MVVIRLADSSGVIHYLTVVNGHPNFEPYSSSPNTQADLKAAFAAAVADSGLSEAAWIEANIIKPEPIPQPQSKTDWQGFAISLLESVTATGAMSPELAQKLTDAARQFNLPEELTQKLLDAL